MSSKYFNSNQNGGLIQKNMPRKKKDKTKYGTHLCSAEVLDYMRVDKEFIDMAIKQTRQRNADDLLFTDMAKIINKYENKLRKNKSKNIIKDLGKTTLKEINVFYGSSGPIGLKQIIKSLTENLSKGYNKIIGMVGHLSKFDENGDELEPEIIFGHYVIIGKSTNNKLYLIDVQENKTYSGLDNIINYLWENWEEESGDGKIINVEYYTDNLYDYQNGLVLKKKK